MLEEIWKDIPGYEGKYQVSNLGSVKSILKTRQKLLKPFSDKDGYFCVSLYINNKRKLRKVHSLVMETFVGHRPDGMDICHNDSDKHNNHLDNLRYDTRSNNNIDNVKQGTICGQKLSADDVRQIRKLLNDNNLTTTDIARMYNVSICTIYDIETHRSWGWLDED